MENRNLTVMGNGISDNYIEKTKLISLIEGRIKRLDENLRRRKPGNGIILVGEIKRQLRDLLDIILTWSNTDSTKNVSGFTRYLHINTDADTVDIPSEVEGIGPIRFAIGDFIVNGYITFKIVGITIINDKPNYKYIIINNDEETVHFQKVKEIDRNYHPWSITDARKGAVIVTPKGNTFIFKNIEEGRIVNDYCGIYFDKFIPKSGTVNGKLDWKLPTDYRPALKAEREEFFKRLREAGYEWDFGTLELKLILKPADIPEP